MAITTKNKKNQKNKKGREAKKYYLLVIVLIGVLVIASLIYFLEQSWEKEVPEAPLVEEPREEEPREEVLFPALEEVGAGEIGEVTIKEDETGEEKPLITPIMPPVIFSTTGKITAVETDSLMMAGDGTNFADGAPRELKCIFTDKTLTFTKNQVKYYKGREGLKILEKGMTILIAGDENIRGKTEFTVKTINIL